MFPCIFSYFRLGEVKDLLGFPVRAGYRNKLQLFSNRVEMVCLCCIRDVKSVQNYRGFDTDDNLYYRSVEI